MTDKVATRTLAILVAASLSTVTLAGCDTIERETGLNKSTQTGVVGGAAAGGIIAALADANPAWIAASIVLGGVTGGVIGNYLGKHDAEQHASTNLRALDSLSQGQTRSWSDTRTGNSGSTTVTAVTEDPSTGRICKSYTESIHTSAKNVTEDATACKVPGGSWHVQHA